MKINFWKSLVSWSRVSKRSRQRRFRKIMSPFLKLAEENLKYQEVQLVDGEASGIDRKDRHAGQRGTENLQPARRENRGAPDDYGRGLKQQIEQLTQAQAELLARRQVVSLKASAPQVRGQWGEMQLLRSNVEMAGMINYCGLSSASLA